MIFSVLFISTVGIVRFIQLSNDHLECNQKIENKDFQGNAVVNYTEAEVPFTRIIEHKHFNFKNQKDTVISWEYPIDYKRGIEPYYPVNDQVNNELFQQYRSLADQEEQVFFGGRLGEYKYYDMHQIIDRALTMVNTFTKKSMNDSTTTGIQ